MIHIGSPIPFETDEFLDQLQTLMAMAYDGEKDKVRDAVADVVQTYHPAGEHGSKYKGTAYDQQIDSNNEEEMAKYKN